MCNAAKLCQAIRRFLRTFMLRFKLLPLGFVTIHTLGLMCFIADFYTEAFHLEFSRMSLPPGKSASVMHVLSTGCQVGPNRVDILCWFFCFNCSREDKEANQKFWLHAISMMKQTKKNVDYSIYIYYMTYLSWFVKMMNVIDNHILAITRKFLLRAYMYRYDMSQFSMTSQAQVDPTATGLHSNLQGQCL